MTNNPTNPTPAHKPWCASMPRPMDTLLGRGGYKCDCGAELQASPAASPQTFSAIVTPGEMSNRGPGGEPTPEQVEAFWFEYLRTPEGERAYREQSIQKFRLTFAAAFASRVGDRLQLEVDAWRLSAKLWRKDVGLPEDATHAQFIDRLAALRAAEAAAAQARKDAFREAAEIALERCQQFNRDAAFAAEQGAPQARERYESFARIAEGIHDLIEKEANNGGRESGWKVKGERGERNQNEG